MQAPLQENLLSVDTFNLLRLESYVIETLDIIPSRQQTIKGLSRYKNCGKFYHHANMSI